MENFVSRLPIDLISIQSDDPRIVRQSRLLQLFVTLISLFGYYQVFNTLINLQPDPSQSQLGAMLLPIGEGLAVIVFATLTFILLHRGRFLPAVHLFFIVLNGLLFLLLFETNKDSVFPYLLLLSVFTIAAVQSNWVSGLYLVILTVGVAIFYETTNAVVVSSAAGFVRLALFLSAPVWFFANDLRKSRDRNKNLAQELEQNLSNLDSQSNQLQQIAEIGRVATASLDRKKLLHDVVELIQKRFGFYHVSVLLISPDGTRLVLEEASGETGQALKEDGYHLTIGQVSIIGWVAINRKARIALDVGDDPYYFSNPDLPDTHSEVALPLIARGRLLGVLDVQSREINAFHDEDISGLQVMADQIASGLDNARLFNDISNQAAVLTQLQSVTNLMNQQANTRNALNVLAEKVPALFEADGGGVFLHQPEEDVLKLLVNLNPNDDRIGRSLAPGEGLSGWAFKENKAHAVDDYTKWAGRSEKYSEAGFYSAVSIPLRRQTQPMGVLTLTRSQKGHPFKPDEIQIAELLSAQVAAVIINNQLIDETRRLVQRERMINQATAQIRRSLDAKTILDTTTAELGNMLANKVVRARLYADEVDLPEDQAV